MSSPMFAPLRPEETAASVPVASADEWKPLIPVPPDAQRAIPKHALGKPSAWWRYQDASGNLLGLVVRFDPPGGKQVLPLTYCEGPNGIREWRWKAFPEPRPLYGLDRLAQRQAARVLIVEGEKAADAAAKMFPDVVAITWPGGAKATAKADWSPLAGRDVVLWSDHDQPGRDAMTAVADALAAIGADALALVNMPAEFPEGWDLADAPPAGWNAEKLGLLIDTARRIETASEAQRDEAEKRESQDSGLCVRRVADIQAMPIRWLWKGRIARGKVSMIAGNPGLGKSQLTASLAATVTTGSKWPVDKTPCDVGSVIILSAEDDPEDTIRPRLEAAGADLERCYVLDAVKDGDGKRAFNLKTDLERLGRQFSEIGDVALAVIDPITAYLGGTDSHKNADVRALLAPLSEIASRHGVAIVCISHLNKGGGGEALSRVMGSLAFVAAARAAYVVARDQADGQRRLFLPAKNNIGNDQTGLAFTVRSYVLDSGIETSRIEWEPDPVTITADEALAVPADPGERDALTEAKEFLTETLAAGPVSAKRVRGDAEAAGHAWATIRRAKDALGVKPAKTGLDGGWVWELPKVPNESEDAQDAQDAQPTDMSTLSTFGGNEHLGGTKADWEADL